MEEGSLVGRDLHPWFVPPLDVDLVYQRGEGRTLTLAAGGVGFSGSCSFWLLVMLSPLTTIQ
eukprot:10446656-Ditylum_brightwellii.AAC.1